MRYTQGGKRIYRSVGRDPQLALIERLKTERVLGAQAAGVQIEGCLGQQLKRTPLEEAIAEYAVEVKVHKSKKTYDAYGLVLKLLRESCAHKYLEELDNNRAAVLTFMAYLKGRGDAPRTVANRVNFLRTFYLNRGLSGR